MNCEEARRLVPEWLAGTPTDPARVALDAHLVSCPACRTELAETRALWQALGHMPTPQPSPLLRTRFYDDLARFRNAEGAGSTAPSAWTRLGQWLESLLTPQYGLRVAYSLALLAGGWLAGYQLTPRPDEAASKAQVTALSAEVAQMRELVMLSLLENPSATERLRAVSYTNEMSRANAKVVDALLSTLNNDENPNVRLATLEALTPLASDPTVRTGLIQSLTTQDSPLVQAALADVMLHLQERRSVPQLRRLLRRPDLNELVKGKLESTIQALAAAEKQPPGRPM